MTDQPVVATEAEAREGAEKKEKRKRDKVRSAWISFVGRIVAQFVGALATVALGVMVLHSYAAPGSRGSAEDPLPTSQRVSVAYSRPATETWLAVLPLENFSADRAQEYLADGMTEALIAGLSKVDSLRVISRTSTMQFKGQRKSLREIAQQLGAQWIIEGSVVREGRRVRITAQLINAHADQHVWAESYDRSAADVLGLQAEVAGAISRAVTAELLFR